MDANVVLQQLPFLNVLLLSATIIYLILKGYQHSSVLLFSVSLLPLLVFELGSYLFMTSSSKLGPLLIISGINFIPLTFTPLSHVLGRESQNHLSLPWKSYYAVQIVLFAILMGDLLTGHVVEWVTGILDQPIILLDKSRRFIFLNTVVACGLTLLCYENTLRSVGRSNVDALKCIFVAFLGFIVYFFYLSSHAVLNAYISHSMLLSGAGVILLGILLLSYSLLKYPFWNVKVLVSRRVVFGALSLTAFVLYLIVSGTLLDLLQSFRPAGFNTFLPVVVFAFAALFLIVYLSPKHKRAFELFVTRHFFRNKYDYRDLWMKFSDRLSGSANVDDLLVKVSQFIADSMLVGPVAIWLRIPDSDTFTLGYSDGHSYTKKDFQVRLQGSLTNNSPSKVYTVPSADVPVQEDSFPLDNINALRILGIKRVVPVEKDNDILALLGVGVNTPDKQSSAEDDRLLASIGNQLANLLLNQRLSDELLLAREWESFNRFSSFVVHDLKNLATLQSMTLENAKEFGNDPRFLSDAFATFGQTTDKMINLIAGLSVQRGKFSLTKRPVNLLEVISKTFDELKINQRNGVTVTTNFPPVDKPPMMAGDPELLKKVFTNLLLNAIQSLPEGHGAVDITVTHPHNGTIRAGIKDTGCGIPPEQIKNLFRPFQTTKKNGMGIGLCHTRSIIEFHGGRIHIDSELNAGTQVEIEFPTL